MLATVKRAALIVNPYSTRVTREQIADVETVLRRQVEVQTEYTNHPGHATELVRANAGDVDAIVVWARETLGSLKAPQVLVVCEELPTTATGKVLRRQVREQLGR